MKPRTRNFRSIHGIDHLIAMGRPDCRRTGPSFGSTHCIPSCRISSLTNTAAV
jgi:hypothetical protein